MPRPADKQVGKPLFNPEMNKSREMSRILVRFPAIQPSHCRAHPQGTRHSRDPALIQQSRIRLVNEKHKVSALFTPSQMLRNGRTLIGREELTSSVWNNIGMFRRTHRSIPTYQIPRCRLSRR